VRPVRIVQVSVGSVRMPPKEGSAPLQVIFNTSKHLARMGHQVVILDRKYGKDDPPVEKIEGVEIAKLNVTQLPSSRAPGFLRFVLAEFNAILFALAVSRYLRENSSNIDVIHLHLTSIGLIVSILNRRLRSKMFYTCHLSQWAFATNKLGISERAHLLLDSYLMRRVTRVIALNDTARESFTHIGKVKAENIAVVPNGVDTDFFNPYIEMEEIARERYGLEGKLTVLFVGRLVKIKGVDHLLKAADAIVNRFGHKHTLFMLVGSEADTGVDEPVNMGEMLAYIRHHQLEKNIMLTGALPLEEVRALYSACDIFVLPSLGESGPIVTLEAMASGKPVIATKIGDTPHQIRDGWNGFLIDPGNEQQLAEKITYLIDNRDDRGRMGENSRRYAEEEFDWGKVSERLLAVYQSKGT